MYSNVVYYVRCNTLDYIRYSQSDTYSFTVKLVSDYDIKESDYSTVNMFYSWSSYSTCWTALSSWENWFWTFIIYGVRTCMSCLLPYSIAFRTLSNSSLNIARIYNYISSFLNDWLMINLIRSFNIPSND